MGEIQSLLNEILLITQFIAALIGFIYLFKLKNSYWKWFSIYLIIIFIQELFWRNSTFIDRKHMVLYYVFFGVPLQFIFLYWLYAIKSLKNRTLFIGIVLLYVITIFISFYFKNISEVYSLTMNIGSTFLIILLILEFIKQIKTDNILNFKENKMFYINVGLILFYIGSYPFFVLGKELQESHLTIWNFYYTYFSATNCIMYLLFSASFIWGKTQS